MRLVVLMLVRRNGSACAKAPADEPSRAAANQPIESKALRPRTSTGRVRQKPDDGPGVLPAPLGILPLSRNDVIKNDMIKTATVHARTRPGRIDGKLRLTRFGLIT